MPMNQAQKMMLLYSSVGSIPGSPAKPTALAAVYDTTNTEIDVTWTAPTDVGDSAIIDYQVQSKVDGGAFADLEANSTDTASTLDNPSTMGNRYDFRVRARNTQGVGPWSDVAGLFVGFGLHNFDETGLTVPGKAFITAALDGQFLWALGSSRSDDTGTLRAGSDVDMGGVVVNAIRRPNNSSVRFHTNDGSYLTWYNGLTTAQQTSLRLYLQFGATDTPVACTRSGNPGGGFMNWTVPLAGRTAWFGVGTGDGFIWAIGYAT